jgi:hypothetical protein
MPGAPLSRRSRISAIFPARSALLFPRGGKSMFLPGRGIFIFRHWAKEIAMVRLTEATVIFKGLAYEFDSTGEAEEFKKRLEAGGDPKRYADAFKCIDIYASPAKREVEEA